MSYPKYKRFTNHGQWRREFDRDPDGNKFKKLWMISAFADPKLILQYYEEPYCFEKIKVMVGMGLVGKYKQELQNEYEAAERLYKKINNKTLKFYGSDGDHQKVYLLQNDKYIKVIVGSPNFTYKATHTGQREGADVHLFTAEDLETNPAAKKYLTEIIDTFEKTEKESSLFMADLIKKIETKSPEFTDEQIIEFWLNAVCDTGSKQEVSELTKTVMEEMLDNPEEKTIRIQKVPKLKPQGKKYLERKGFVFDNDGGVSIPQETFISQEDETVLPMMHIDMDKEKVTLGIGGKLKKRSNSNLNPESINKCLDGVEKVVEEVDNADCDCAHPNEAKTVFYETLLHHFLAPFASILQEEKHKKVGLADPKGPRFLCLQGPSHNGKTTITNILNKWLTGENYCNSNAASLKTAGIKSLVSHGINSNTCFPIILDDLKSGIINRKSSPVESVFKSHWEQNWSPGKVMPQIIITTNEGSLPEWAKSRFLYVRFNVRFHTTAKNQLSIHKTLSEDNEIFTYFSTVAIRKIKNMDHQIDDLFIARESFKKLYEIAGRPLPEYFPQKPLEELYDQDANLAWATLNIWNTAKRTVNKSNQLRYKFDNSKSLKQFTAYLPQGIIYKKEGFELLIENPKQFNAWIKKGKNNQTTSLISRFTNLFNKFTK